MSSLRKRYGLFEDFYSVNYFLKISWKLKTFNRFFLQVFYEQNTFNRSSLNRKSVTGLLCREDLNRENSTTFKRPVKGVLLREDLPSIESHPFIEVWWKVFFHRRHENEVLPYRPFKSSSVYWRPLNFLLSIEVL